MESRLIPKSVENRQTELDAVREEKVLGVFRREDYFQLGHQGGPEFRQRYREKNIPGAKERLRSQSMTFQYALN